MYSLRNEEQLIKDYFGNFQGTLLSLGENDGKTLSNVYAALIDGWHGVLVEPSKTAFSKLYELWKDRQDIELVNVAISDTDGIAEFFESGTHLGTGDTSLLSSLKKDETVKWTRETFTQTEIATLTYKSLLTKVRRIKYDLISVDCEGVDWEILQQIDLTDTKMLIVEFNGIDKVKYVDYCAKFGLHLYSQNPENIIFVK